MTRFLKSKAQLARLRKSKISRINRYANELVHHKNMAEKTGCPVSVCHPLGKMQTGEDGRQWIVSHQFTNGKSKLVWKPMKGAKASLPEPPPMPEGEDVMSKKEDDILKPQVEQPSEEKQLDQLETKVLEINPDDMVPL